MNKILRKKEYVNFPRYVFPFLFFSYFFHLLPIIFVFFIGVKQVPYLGQCVAMVQQQIVATPKMVTGIVTCSTTLFIRTLRRTLLFDLCSSCLLCLFIR